MARLRRKWQRNGARLWLVVAILLLSALPGDAELVVFTSGHFLKAKALEVRDEAMRLVLRSGGILTVPLSVVERVVDDEVEEATEPLREEKTVPIAFPKSAGIPDTPYGELIFAAAEKQRLNPQLVAAVVRAESAFDPHAVSHKGARGLMQLMPATARRFGVATEDLFDPQRNLEAGTRYLVWLSKRYPDDLQRILAAYNAGEGNVDRYDGVPPFKETRNYIRRIYSALGLS